MRRILVLNPKGGCGKSTLATNLASYSAVHGTQEIRQAGTDAAHPGAALADGHASHGQIH